MRGSTAKRLRKQAAKDSSGESTKFQYSDGSVRWDGAIRLYKDLKKKWKESNIFQKEGFFK